MKLIVPAVNLLALRYLSRSVAEQLRARGLSAFDVIAIVFLAILAIFLASNVLVRVFPLVDITTTTFPRVLAGWFNNSYGSSTRAFQPEISRANRAEA